VETVKAPIEDYELYSSANALKDENEHSSSATEEFEEEQEEATKNEDIKTGNSNKDKQFAHVKSPNESSSSVSPIQRRTALWAIGQIGSSPTGFKLLMEHESEIVKVISDMAMQCTTLSMRGTCFYIMGLLSRTQSARSVLYDMGWRFSPNQDVGIVIPKDTHSFLHVPKCEYKGSWPMNHHKDFGLSYVPIKNAPLPETTLRTDYSNCKQVILGYVSNLCNNVTIKASLNMLRILKKDKKARPLFSSSEVFFEVFKMIASYNFQLEARRCIFDELFNDVEATKTSLRVFDKPLHGRLVKKQDRRQEQADAKKEGSEQVKQTAPSETNAVSKVQKKSKPPLPHVSNKADHRIVGFNFTGSSSVENRFT